MKASVTLKNLQELQTTKETKSEKIHSIKQNSRNLDMSLATDESLYLMGLPKLSHFLQFIHTQAMTPQGKETLIKEWQCAKDYYHSLEKEEPGCADRVGITPITVDTKYEPLLIKLLQNPLIKNGFDDLPTEVAFVDLDQLVVYQKHIDITFVRNLCEQLGSAPSDEQIFQTCLPYDYSHPPSRWSRIDDSNYVFISRSNDVRFLGVMPLESGHIHGYPHPGNLLGVIGLAVGFGSNFLNAIHAENRLILHNGSHRAYALRSMGIKRVPCIIQYASNRDEFAMAAPNNVVQHADFYLKHPRPPMLKDYFNPRLRKIVDVQRVLRQVKIHFSVSEYYIPAI